MRLSGYDQSHLTYCTNIHAGESWPQIQESLYACLPAIKEKTAKGDAFGIGLRLGATASAALSEPSTLKEFQHFLSSGNYYAPTINGFPFGPFHGQPVKENVYAPDWRKKERLQYTNELANLLPSLMGTIEYGSISTVPGSYKGWVTLDDKTLSAQIARNMVAHVSTLLAIKARTGKTIALALEPEPCCMLETIDETITFFNEYLFSKIAIDHLRSLTGLSVSDAEHALHQHIGVCYDVCHAAVEFEDPEKSISALIDSGISIPKVQLSSALRITSVSENTDELLERFVEPVYLHQVIENNRSELTRYLDLPAALVNKMNSLNSEWRIHFHVPIFLEQMEAFDTTQFFLKEILELYKRNPFSPHLEVETYTWDVLPQQYRDGNITDNISRELNWVKNQLS